MNNWNTFKTAVASTVPAIVRFDKLILVNGSRRALTVTNISFQGYDEDNLASAWPSGYVQSTNLESGAGLPVTLLPGQTIPVPVTATTKCAANLVYYSIRVSESAEPFEGQLSEDRPGYYFVEAAVGIKDGAPSAHGFFLEPMTRRELGDYFKYERVDPKSTSIPPKNKEKFVGEATDFITAPNDPKAADARPFRPLPGDHNIVLVNRDSKITVTKVKVGSGADWIELQKPIGQTCDSQTLDDCKLQRDWQFLCNVPSGTSVCVWIAYTKNGDPRVKIARWRADFTPPSSNDPTVSVIDDGKL